MGSVPQPIHIEISEDVIFEDRGSAFVRALQERLSPFGKLTFVKAVKLDKDILERLLQVSTIEELNLPVLKDECLLLPFSAPVQALFYTISSKSALKKGLDSIRIVAKELFLRILDEKDRPAEVGKEIIQAVARSENLELLDLTDYKYWGSHMKDLLSMMEEHKGLRVFQIDEYPSKRDPDMLWIKQLLSRNRKIRVVHWSGDTVSDGTCIEALYSLNRFYCGSASLVKEQKSLLPSLVGLTLMKNATNNFQRSALLLANHVTVLVDFIQGVLAPDNTERAEVLSALGDVSEPDDGTNQSERNQSGDDTTLPEFVNGENDSPAAVISEPAHGKGTKRKGAPKSY